MDNKKYKWPAYEEPPHYAHQEKLNDIRARFVSKRAILVDLFTYVNGRVDDITDVLELCKAIGFATGKNFLKHNAKKIFQENFFRTLRTFYTNLTNF
ncbi:unnamed protein product [Meloidogyne enterolobii]|uniref:Uncharacterized protein n=1 Tax=Meloidogyne enterolobii TaxID=390850 RepID=A0ACB0ZPB4_MELEN